jgi:hypothetical protein
MSLDEMLKTELPLNRKERFFTGTVFPMIVCKENFKFLHLLFPLINCFQTIKIISSPNKTNILFFTEYSLIESLIGKSKQRFKELPKAKDTPDIIIQINSDPKLLIVLEAKMYDNPEGVATKLNKQMMDQKKILECIQKTLSVDEDNTYHYALLPQKLKEKVPELSFPVITWEDIYKQYEPVCKGDYFFDLLRVGLEMYDDLVSSITFNRNCEEKIKGQQIYNHFKQNTLGNMLYMGRDNGITGNKLRQDINTNKWRDYPYETSCENPGNKNWFLIEDFVKLIDQKQ